MVRAQQINAASVRLYVTDQVSAETIASAYLRFQAQGLLDRILYEDAQPRGIRAFLDWACDRAHTVLACFVERNGQVDLAGLGWLVDVCDLDAVRRGEVGVAFFREVPPWMTLELSEMMLDHVFQNLGVTVAITKTPAKNRASLCFQRRVGFVSEARLPRYSLWKGQPCDLVISHLTSERWEKGGDPAVRLGKAGSSLSGPEGGV
jgi:hypothetical protein